MAETFAPALDPVLHLSFHLVERSVGGLTRVVEGPTLGRSVTDEDLVPRKAEVDRDSVELTAASMVTCKLDHDAARDNTVEQTLELLGAATYVGRERIRVRDAAKRELKGCLHGRASACSRRTNRSRRLNREALFLLGRWATASRSRDPHAGEVDEAALDICVDQFRASVIADIETLESAYSPRPRSLTTDRESSGKRSASARRRLVRNNASASPLGSAGNVAPSASARATILPQRSGERSTLRSDRKPLRARYRAVTPLAATIRSSISSLARFGSSGLRSASSPPWSTDSALGVCKLNAPWWNRTS